MAAAYPIVYTSASLEQLILHILNHHAVPSVIIICMPQARFIQELLISIEVGSKQEFGSGELEERETAVQMDSGNDNTSPLRVKIRDQPHEALAVIRPHPLLEPTLRLLSTSSTVRLAFVTSVPALHAYLAALSLKVQDVQHATSTPVKTPTLALLGVVSLHKHTSAFSAQGLGKTFAAAIEAGYEAGMRVVVWEGFGEADNDEKNELTGFTSTHDRLNGSHLTTGDVNQGDAMDTLNGTEGADGAVLFLENNESGRNSANMDIWNEEVPVLNAATKTFGPAGERRGWLGRTVKVADVVERWFTFEASPNQEVL